MIRVGDVARIIERAAPPALALPDDNPGLQLGSAAAPVRSILVALDPTPAAVRRAAAAKADLLVTHHPLFIDPLRRIDTGTATGAAAAAALGAGIAVYAAHTNLDAAPGGLAVEAARLLGLARRALPAPGRRPARASRSSSSRRPRPRRGCTPRWPPRARGSSGATTPAPSSGAARGSSGRSPGRAPPSARRAGSSASPRRGSRWSPTRRQLPAVLAAIRRVHPYEEPAVDCLPAAPRRRSGGFGCVGSVAPASLRARSSARAAAALRRRGARLRARGRRACAPSRSARAAAGGSSRVAAAAGADVFVTGEVRYHVMREAEHHGIAIVELGHDRTEMPAVDLLSRLIREGWPPRGAARPGRHLQGAAGRTDRGREVETGMYEQLENLIRLQELDRETARLTQKLAEIAPQIEETRLHLAAAERALEEGKSRVEGARKDRRAAEKELEEQIEKRRKFQEQQSKVKTNKEYQALMGELEALKVEETAAEDRILALMEGQAEAERLLPGLTAEVGREKAEFQQKEQVLRGEEEKLRGELAAAEEPRAAVVATLEPATLQTYQRILKLRGSAVSPRCATSSASGAARRCRRRTSWRPCATSTSTAARTATGSSTTSSPRSRPAGAAPRPRSRGPRRDPRPARRPRGARRVAGRRRGARALPRPGARGAARDRPRRRGAAAARERRPAAGAGAPRPRRRGRRGRPGPQRSRSTSTAARAATRARPAPAPTSRTARARRWSASRATSGAPRTTPPSTRRC